MQLGRRAWTIAVTLSAIITGIGTAHADGEVSIRGAYYKEDATRVVQPMVDAALEVGPNGQLNFHGLLDSITSASAASGAAGAVAFEEKRVEGGASYLHRLDALTIGGRFRYSKESDYTSIFGSVIGEIALAQQNTILGTTIAIGRDDVSNAGGQTMLTEPIEGNLNTTMGSLRGSQILSPLVVAGLTYDLVYLKGFQENVYRRVPAGGRLVSERVPDTRWRHAAFGSVRAYVPPTDSTIIAGYRFYVDDWGIVGHTPEVRVVQQIISDLLVSVRFRYYRQNAADFYKDVYNSSDPAVEEFITGDPKLDAMRTLTYGLKIEGALSVLGVGGALGRLRGEALVEYVNQNNRFGNAINAQLALIVPFEY